MAKYDWELIKNEYLANDITYQELSEKHGISYSTLEKRARRENWKSAKSAIGEKVAKEVRKKVAKKIATQTAKKVDLVTDSLDRLLQIINKTVQDAEQFNKHIVKLRNNYNDGSSEENLVVEHNEVVDTKRLESLISSLDKATKLHRLINNVIDEPVKQKLDIERQRLDVERSRAKVPGIDDDEDETGVVLLPEVNHSLNTEEGVQGD